MNANFTFVLVSMKNVCTIPGYYGHGYLHGRSVMLIIRDRKDTTEDTTLVVLATIMADIILLLLLYYYYYIYYYKYNAILTEMCHAQYLASAIQYDFNHQQQNSFGNKTLRS